MPHLTVDFPLRYRFRPLLLVEIKRPNHHVELFDFLYVFEQSAQQARYAFASFPKMLIIGVITSLGDCWTYREYDRRDLSPSPTRSEYSDPSFVDSSPPDGAPSNTGGIDFGNRGFVRLQEPPSDHAFDAVKERMKVLSALL